MAEEVGRWISVAGVVAAIFAMVFSSVGLAAAWWTSVEGGPQYPISTAATLWVTSTTFYDVPKVNDDFACNGPCDSTQHGRIRVITSCQAWDNFCSKARATCGLPKVDNQVSTSPLLYPRAGTTNMPLPAPAPAPPPRLSPPTLPPPVWNFAQNVGPTTTVITTRTFTSTFTTTSTTVTTRTTRPFTPIPIVPRQGLRPSTCPTLSPAQFLAAEYTPWELHWSLDYRVVAAIYASLNRGLSQIPATMFSQRPTMMEQVRLLWETLVVRSKFPDWMWEYTSGWCPSAPAETMYNWLYLDEHRWTRELILEGLTPPDVTPEGFIDGALKEAWELQVGLGTTTPAPLYERGSNLGQTSTKPPLQIVTFPRQDQNVVVESGPAERIQPAPQMSFAACQTAPSDVLGGPNPWTEEMEPCDLMASCNKCLAIRAGLALQLLLSLLHTAPSCLSFMSWGQRFQTRFPPTMEYYLALGGCMGVAVAIGVSIWSGLAGVDGLALNGVGFGCSLAALACCIVSAIFARCAVTATRLDEAVVLEVEERKANLPVVLTTSTKDLPPPRLGRAPVVLPINPAESDFTESQTSGPGQSGTPVVLTPGQSRAMLAWVDEENQAAAEKA